MYQHMKFFRFILFSSIHILLLDNISVYAANTDSKSQEEEKEKSPNTEVLITFENAGVTCLQNYSQHTNKSISGCTPMCVELAWRYQQDQANGIEWVENDLNKLSDILEP